MSDIEIAYQESLDYLYSFIDYSLTRNFRYTPDKFELGRMYDFLRLFDDPHHAYPVIHVAGTKGKGSTSALIASAYQAAGYQVGFYTSPHLIDFSERIQVNGENISHESIIGLVGEFRDKVPLVKHLTTFELTTALALLYFARQEVDVAVIEVGLGGRLDATNVVDPLVSVITSISYDHTHVLGDTIAKIATEKAGIIKEGRPIIIAPQKEEARIVIDRIAKERNAPLTQVGRDYFFAPWSHSLNNQTFLVWSTQEQPLVVDFIESAGRSAWQPLRLTIPLLGYHQVENAATAYSALHVARENGLYINDCDIQRGFTQVKWSGRFEVMSREPLLIIDSAHNQDSALRLRLAIDDYLSDKPVILIFGASEDKDIHGMFSVLLPRVRRVIATQSVHPRAVDADDLVDMAHKFATPAQAIVPVEKALEQAIEMADSEYAIVVAGSLFVASAVRECWLKTQQELINKNI